MSVLRLSIGTSTSRLLTTDRRESTILTRVALSRMRINNNGYGGVTVNIMTCGSSYTKRMALSDRYSSLAEIMARDRQRVFTSTMTKVYFVRTERMATGVHRQNSNRFSLQNGRNNMGFVVTRLPLRRVTRLIRRINRDVIRIISLLIRNFSNLYNLRVGDDIRDTFSPGFYGGREPN